MDNETRLAFEKLGEQLNRMDQRLENIEADVQTIKVVLQIDQQVENLKTITRRAPATAQESC